MRKAIYAHTPSGPQPPPYVNLTDVGDGEHVELTVRDHPQMVEHENGAWLDGGHTTTLVLHRDRVIEMARAVLDAYEPRRVFVAEVGDDVRGEFAKTWYGGYGPAMPLAYRETVPRAFRAFTGAPLPHPLHASVMPIIGDGPAVQNT